MHFHISTKLRDAVFERVQRAEGNGRYMNVYQVAQEVQNEHPLENAAIEDIVETLVEFAAGKSLALELSHPKQDGLIPIDFLVTESAE